MYDAGKYQQADDSRLPAIGRTSVLLRSIVEVCMRVAECCIMGKSAQHFVACVKMLAELALHCIACHWKIAFKWKPEIVVVVMIVAVVVLVTYYLRCRLANGKGIVSLGVCRAVCVSAALVSTVKVIHCIQ